MKWTPMFQLRKTNFKIYFFHQSLNISHTICTCCCLIIGKSNLSNYRILRKQNTPHQSNSGLLRCGMWLLTSKNLIYYTKHICSLNGLWILFNTSPDPMGGLHSNASDISLSNSMSCSCGVVYFYLRPSYFVFLLSNP